MSYFENHHTFLPASYSFTNVLLKRVDTQLKSNRYVASSANLAAFGFLTGLGSAVYHAIALVKTPVIVLKLAARVTVFSLPFVGSKLDKKLPSLPGGFEYSTPFVHALKVATCAFSAFFTPVCGIVLLPGAAVWLNQALGLTEKPKVESPSIPQPPLPPPPPPPASLKRAATLPLKTTSKQDSSTGQSVNVTKAKPTTSSRPSIFSAAELTSRRSGLNKVSQPSSSSAQTTSSGTKPANAQPLITDPQLLLKARRSLRASLPLPQKEQAESPQQKFLTNLHKRVSVAVQTEAQPSENESTTMPQKNDDKEWDDVLPASTAKTVTSSSTAPQKREYLSRSVSFHIPRPQGAIRIDESQQIGLPPVASSSDKIAARRQKIDPPEANEEWD